jgi:hypothetical protein
MYFFFWRATSIARTRLPAGYESSPHASKHSRFNHRIMCVQRARLASVQMCHDQKLHLNIPALRGSIEEAG